MSEVTRDIDFWIRLQNKNLKVFLKNGFKYEGRLKAICEDFLDILDFKLGTSKIIRIEDIADLEVLN